MQNIIDVKTKKHALQNYNSLNVLSHLIKNKRKHNYRKTENSEYKIFLINQTGFHLLLLLNLTATNAAMNFACSEEKLNWIINQIKALNLYPCESNAPL